MTRAAWFTVLPLLLLGCQKTPVPSPPVPSPAVEAASTHAVHDPNNPPIDCPLRAQGVDPAKLKPFEDTAKYIEFLERADRAAWQKPAEVVSALALKGTEVVFDVGAGSGYFSFPLAKALPKGKVVAADPEPDMIRWVHHTSMTRGVTNILAKITDVDQPGVTDEADLVFLCDVLHHVPDRAAWFKKLTAPLKSGARVALIEFKEGKLPEGPPESMKLPRAELLALATDAGLVLDVEHAQLLPYQVFLVFKKP